MMQTEPLEMWIWTIYSHPSDYPDSFVVRVHVLGRDGSCTPQQECSITSTLEQARAIIPGHLIRLPRYEEDDKAIVEVWL